MNLSRAGISVLAMLLVMSGVSFVAARTWQVPSEVPSIAAGLQFAVAGDTVQVACGTYFEHDLILASGVVLRSETGLADCVTIDAQQQGRVFLAVDLTQAAVLSGLTITGGYLPDDSAYAGGIYCLNSSLHISQCNIEGNYTGYAGGGIYAQHSELVVTGTRFGENEGEHGGGGAIRADDIEGEFVSCLFEGNLGIDGAGVFLSHSSPDFDHCTFLNNDGWFFGGAVFCVSGSNPLFEHCTLVGNEAHLGAGLMAAAESSPTFDACIIAFNRDGSGIECHDQYSDPTISCSDVFGNEDGGYSGYIDDQTGLNGNLALEPWFCDLDAGDLTLATGSPCLPAHNDCSVVMGAHAEGCTITPVTDQPALGWRLAPNHPNPFNPRTTISFGLTAPATVDLRIHDLAGRLIAVLLHGREEAGSHAVIWEGRDQQGRTMPSGTYFYRLRVADRTETRAMQLVR